VRACIQLCICTADAWAAVIVSVRYNVKFQQLQATASCAFHSAGKRAANAATAGNEFESIVHWDEYHMQLHSHTQKRPLVFFPGTSLDAQPATSPCHLLVPC
jgi:hypothetical protein